MKNSKHAMSWFEIPVKNMDRAKRFYEIIFDIELNSMDIDENFKMELFPGDQDAVSGSLVYNEEWYQPSHTHGPLIYLNAEPNLQVVEDRIESAGGKVTIPKRQISPEHGYMGVFIDSEGNRIALYSSN